MVFPVSFVHFGVVGIALVHLNWSELLSGTIKILKDTLYEGMKSDANS